jgi:PAS domain S-box-containing protein
VNPNNLIPLNEPRDLPRAMAALPAVSSAIAIVVGTLVLTGWIVGAEILKRIVPAFVAMNPATAIAFILAGGSLALSRDGAQRSITPRILAGMVLMIGSAKLVGIGFGWKPGVDEIFFASKLSSSFDTLPNRMAPNTAFIFVLLGLALLALDLEVKRFSLSQAFALAAAFCALLSVTGYAYGVSSFYGLASFIPMALHTAITSLLLAIGVLFARKATPLSQIFATDDPSGVVARRLFPLAILLTLVLGWLRLKGEAYGLYETRFGTALFAIVLSGLFVVLVRWTVCTIGRVEADKAVVNRALLESKVELQESLRQMQLIINHAHELICSVDNEGRLVSVSAASESMLGYAPSALLGTAFNTWVCAEDQRAAETALRRARTGLTVGNFTSRLQRRDGSLAPIAWSVQYSDHSRKIYCVGRQADGSSDQSLWGAAS